MRRRNGSWWPGRILGPNELAASHLMSPRSGTPVKLLGREDASVDWYNLEKSKRVKAFRCGEFDDCIERAESSQGIPIRKREKYARREDAILHALELEKQHLEKKQQKLGIASSCTSNKTSVIFKNEFGNSSPSESHLRSNEARDHKKIVNLKSDLLSKRRDPLNEQKGMGNPLYAQNVKYTKRAGWEDDNSENLPRMKGLQDFGLRTARSKGNVSTLVPCEGSQQPLSINGRVLVSSSGVHNMGTPNHASTVNNSLAIKRKRSQSGLIEESLVKRRDRRRPLVQVLQSTAKLPMGQSLKSNDDGPSISIQREKEHMGLNYRAKRSRCVYLPCESSDYLDHAGFPSERMQLSASHVGTNNCVHPGSLSEETTSSGLIEARESDSSEGDDSDLNMEKEAAGLSDPSNSGRYVRHNDSVPRVPAQLGNGSNEELDDALPFSLHEQTADAAADMRGSKWQLKGKRNTRSLIKRPMEIMDSRDYDTIADKCNGSIHGSYYEGKGSTVRASRSDRQQALGQVGYHRSEGLSYGYDEDDLIENDLVQTHMVGFTNKKYPLPSKASSRDRGRSNNNINSLDGDFCGMPLSVWEGDRLSQEALGGYWEDPDECFDPLYVDRPGDGMGSMFVNVDLKVQASYQGERVPLVSLMSRLNGKAIIGHPVQIEAMEDGSSDFLLSANDFCEEAPEIDGNTGLPQVWRTARRTAMYRVPRPHPSSALREEADHLPSSDLEIRPSVKKSYAGYLNHKVRPMKKSFSHIRRPLPEKKFPKKLLKKISLSSQKTRTLSSIAIEQKFSGKSREQKLSGKDEDADGSIKPKEVVPSVTCVPVKLVFSRILEAVGRFPSKTAVQKVFTGSEEGKP